MCIGLSARAEAPPPAAKAHFEAGSAYYSAERWAEAISEFQEAYRLSHFPELLLDMARAETHLGKEVEAISHLEAYVAARPDASDTPSVRAEIIARKKALAESEAAARARAETERVKEEAARPKPARWPGITLIVAGVALGATGIGLGVAATQQAALVSGGGVKDPDGTGSFDWVSAHDGLYPSAQTDGKRFAAAGIALDVIGVAAIAAGAGLLGWALHDRNDKKARP
jgi:tetratricopeptide (TPR) repeat protein